MYKEEVCECVVSQGLQARRIYHHRHYHHHQHREDYTYHEEQLSLLQLS